jgi:head-tail adaptor
MGWIADEVALDLLDDIADAGPDAITVQTYTETISTSGQTSRAWATLETGDALVTVRNGREFLQDEKLTGRVFYDVFYVTDTAITPDMRILYGSQVLNIEEVFPLSAGTTAKQLRCVEVTGTV